jgi:5-bromo-4-chloroindolyl phosphate hydrolysis protein
MNKKTAKVMAAYLLGNIMQIVLQILAKVSYMSRPILFCIAAGFLVVIAVVAGISLADSNREPEKQKSYREYAEEAGLSEDE